MADNTVLGAAVGTGDNISTDDLGTVKVQRVKVQHGADGSATDVSTASPLPAVLQTAQVADGGTLPTTGVQVGGTDGSVFQVISTDNAGRVNTNINGTVTTTGGLTDTQLRASAVSVDTELPAAAALADATTNPSTSVIGSMLLCYNGTTWDRARGDTTNGVFVNVKATAAPSSLPLPAGASTAAKQPALGTAGSPSTDVISVQGVGSGTAIPVSGTVTATGPLTDTQLRATAVPVSGTVTASGPLTDTQLRATAVPVSAASLPLPTGASTAAKQPALGTAGTPSADVLSIQGVASMTALKVDGSAVTQPVSGNVSLAAAAGAAGLSKFHLVSAGSTNATNVKASAGKLHGWYIYNSNAAARKVAFHNTTGTPTAGASVTDSIVIPPASGANAFSEIGIAFSTGIAISTVTGLADSDANAVAANDLVINLYFA